MMRTVASALLVTSLLSASVAAQRGGVSRGGASASAHSGRSFHGSISPAFPRGHVHRNRDGAFLYPYGWPYDAPYNYSEPVTEVAPREPAPVAVQPVVPQPPIAPKLIEVPGAANAVAEKPLPPAIFILASGERLETSRFLLRSHDVSVTVKRQQRSIPLEQLDLDATLAANRERGVDLEIPTDPNQISLRF